MSHSSTTRRHCENSHLQLANSGFRAIDLDVCSHALSAIQNVDLTVNQPISQISSVDDDFTTRFENRHAVPQTDLGEQSAKTGGDRMGVNCAVMNG